MKGRLTSMCLKDGRFLHMDHAADRDAASLIEYLNRVGGDSDFLTFGKNEFELSVAEEEAFIRSSAEKGHLYLVGKIDGVIISTLILMRGKRARTRHVAELSISVLAQHWEIGVGRHMLSEALRLAKELEIKKIVLSVREDNKRAIGLYESLGFQNEGLSTKAYLINNKFYSSRHMGLET